MRIIVCDRCQERCETYVRLDMERRHGTATVLVVSMSDPGPVDLCDACAQHVAAVARGQR